MTKHRFKLAHINDLPKGTRKVFLLPDGQELTLFHTEEGIFAIDNACPHMGGPLNEGEVSDCTVTCPWHGWSFNLKTGNCVNMPGEDATVFPLEILSGEIYVLLDEE